RRGGGSVAGACRAGLVPTGGVARRSKSRASVPSYSAPPRSFLNRDRGGWPSLGAATLQRSGCSLNCSIWRAGFTPSCTTPLRPAKAYMLAMTAKTRLAWNGVFLSDPCSLATCVRVTLSALVAPSSGLMSLSNRLDQAAALVLQAAMPPRAVSLPDASRASDRKDSTPRHGRLLHPSSWAQRDDRDHAADNF